MHLPEDASLPARNTPADPGHLLFETALGTCGVAWGTGGIVAVQLPERDAAATRARLLRGLPLCQGTGDPPPYVRSAITGIQALLAGEPRDLREVPLDMSRISPFHQQVYAIARAIPPGRTRTYGELAQQLGGLGLARAVGQALAGLAAVVGDGADHLRPGEEDVAKLCRHEPLSRSPERRGGGDDRPNLPTKGYEGGRRAG